MISPQQIIVPKRRELWKPDCVRLYKQDDVMREQERWRATVPPSVVGAAANVPNATPATALDPLTIVTSVSWRWFYSADAGIAEAGGAGTGVSTWSDQSGNTRHATQATLARRPAVNATGLNGHGFLSFDGTDDWLELATWDPPQPSVGAMWFWGVIKPRTYVSGANLFSASSTTVLRCRMSATVNTLGCANPTAGPVVTFTPGNWYRFEALFNNLTDYTKLGSAVSTPAGTTGDNNAGSGTFRICTDAILRWGPFDIACLGCTTGEATPGEKSALDSSWVPAWYGVSVAV